MKMNVLVASQQVRGIDGSGGLGDVPVALAKSLLPRGDVDIRFIMPGFSLVSGQADHPALKGRFDPKHRLLSGLKVPFGDSTVRVEVYQLKVPGTSIDCYLLRCRDFDELDRNADLYAVDGRGVPNKNTAPRAIVFARAVVEFVREYREFRVDVLHCNDWNTGLIPVFLRTIYGDDAYLGRIATVYTTHNAGGQAYQGGFSVIGNYRQNRGTESLLGLAGLKHADVFQGGVTRSLHHEDKFNFTKGAFGFADVLNTVSSRYRRELLTPAFAGGLEGVLSERRGDFAGIVNGIDTEEWNPAADMNLEGYAYSASDAPDVIRRRKRELRSKLRNWQVLKTSDQHRAGGRPFAELRDESILLGVVSRIDYQKAPILLGRIRDLGEHSVAPTLDEEIEWRVKNDVINPIGQLMGSHADLQIVVLGNANDPYGSRFVGLLHDLRRRFPGKVMFFEGFDIPLSHLIYATTEIFLQPSMFEPCGLTQLVAMRYGAVPVVRAVGGLVDTVVDYGDANGLDKATGFRFLEEQIGASQMVNERTAPTAFVAAVERALNVIRTDANLWDQLIANATKYDSSWAVPAQQYFRLYEDALRRNLRVAFFEHS
jgi:starch synthase